MNDDHVKSQKKSERNFWGTLICLVLVAIFAPERYSILIFLGAIWVILFEISDRLRTQYNYSKRTTEAVECIAGHMQSR